jgi:8-oxo-dGTP diphosphatase
MTRVVVGICAHSGKILMGRRLANDGSYGGYWEFPGGKIEPGETEVEALKREFQEELGAEVVSAEFFKKIVWDYPQKTVELNFYFIELNTLKLENLRLNSHTELKWVTKDEALSKPLLPANVELVKSL